MPRPQPCRAPDTASPAPNACRSSLGRSWGRGPFVAASHGVRDLVHFGFMTKTIPVREFRSNLAELLSDVADRRDHVVVTRNGRPAAALVPIDEYQALEETAEILSDAATLTALQAGLDELARGDTIDLGDLRRELSEKRTAR
jgi:antitoxin YefM